MNQRFTEGTAFRAPLSGATGGNRVHSDLLYALCSGTHNGVPTPREALIPPVFQKAILDGLVGLITKPWPKCI